MPAFVRTKLVRVTQKKFTVSVGAIVTNEKNQILLLNHVFRPGSGWGIPGGFIEYGEQIDDAIKREVLEETGLKLEKVELCRVETRENRLEFLARGYAKGAGEVKSIEIKSLGWFDLDNLPAKMSDAQKQTVREVLSNKSK